MTVPVMEKLLDYYTVTAERETSFELGCRCKPVTKFRALSGCA